MSYDYSSWEPVNVKAEDLSKEEKFLLKDSETFCIYPWIHLHSYPTGETYPCCHADMQIPVGNNKEDALKDIWNNHNMRELRNDMLMGHHNNICNGCYEQESHGWTSMRQSSNKIKKHRQLGSLSKMSYLGSKKTKFGQKLEMMIPQRERRCSD